MLRKLLELSRYVLVLPVIGSLLLALSVVVMGLGSLLAEQRKLLESGEFSAKAAKQLTLLVIQSVDMFLVAAIAYIVAVGIYKLFISQDEARLLKRVRIEKLADLENKIIGVVVVALAIGFLGRAEEAMDAKALLFGGAGVSLVI
ncbi:MAG: YqhA family protein, partial [Planctomycetes bacterium]|nr:YqhA family protein [Planctomycetota bacterium]